MSRLNPYKYIEDGDLNGHIATPPIIDCRSLDWLSFTAEWTGSSSPIGAFSIEVSDDPRAHGDRRNSTNTATWVKRTIPDGACDGTNITVSGTTITTNGSAGKFNLMLTDLPAFVRLPYARTSGGAADQLQVYASGD